MQKGCPFCGGRRVEPVRQPLGWGAATGSRGRLMACLGCERWYWQDSGEEVPRLFEICVTAVVSPGRCAEGVRAVLNSGGRGFPDRCIAVLNRLCGDCRNARFASRKGSALP